MLLSDFINPKIQCGFNGKCDEIANYVRTRERGETKITVAATVDDDRAAQAQARARARVYVVYPEIFSC